MRIFGVAHWLIPWLILVLGMYAIVRFVRGYINDKAFAEADRRLVAVFSGMMDLQVAIGLVHFLWTGFAGIGFPLYRVLHGIIMFIAAIIPHFSSYWKNSDDQTRYLNNFFLLLGSFFLMLVGLSLIP